MLVLTLAALDLVVEGRAELARLSHVAVALHLEVEAGSARPDLTYFCTPDVVHIVIASSRKCVAKKVKHCGERQRRQTYLGLDELLGDCLRETDAFDRRRAAAELASAGHMDWQTLTSSTSTRERLVAIPEHERSRRLSPTENHGRSCHLSRKGRERLLHVVR